MAVVVVVTVVGVRARMPARHVFSPVPVGSLAWRAAGRQRIHLK
jgi:hypothetical protein